MKGDFSRGHAPDYARRLPEDIDPSEDSRRQYHRVLMQQGRLLLDSDYNATVDALTRTTRLGVRLLGCDAGSPDLGFLVTPGRLLGVWRTPEGAEVLSGDPDLWLDHRYKYLSRYPGFYIGNPIEEPDGSSDTSPSSGSPDSPSSGTSSTAAGDKSPDDSPSSSSSPSSPDSSPPSSPEPSKTLLPTSPDSSPSSPDSSSPPSSPDSRFTSPSSGSSPSDSSSPDGSPSDGSPRDSTVASDSPPAAEATPAVVRLPLRQAFDSEVSTLLAVWIRYEGTDAIDILVNGVTLTLSGPTTDYERFTVVFAPAADGSSDFVDVTVPPDGAIWIGLIEQDQDANSAPVFWAALGAYEVDGLIVGNPEDNAFPAISFPE